MHSLLPRAFLRDSSKQRDSGLPRNTRRSSLSGVVMRATHSPSHLDSSRDSMRNPPKDSVYSRVSRRSSLGGVRIGESSSPTAHPRGSSYTRDSKRSSPVVEAFGCDTRSTLTTQRSSHMESMRDSSLPKDSSRSVLLVEDLEGVWLARASTTCRTLWIG